MHRGPAACAVVIALVAGHAGCAQPGVTGRPGRSTASPTAYRLSQADDQFLSAENLRTGRVWSWFLQNPEIAGALSRVESAGQ